MATRFNTEYASLWKEVPLFLNFALRPARPASVTGKVLIVNTCLVGEFAASMPAIHTFIRKHPELVVDLLVAPPLKKLASHIRGIGTVYTARSVYEREDAEEAEALPGDYDGIIALRMSRDARALIRAANPRWVETGARHFLRYGAHLLQSLRRREMPKQWRTLNFEMLGLEPIEVSHNDILMFPEEEHARVRSLEAFQAPGSAVIVHTWTKWPMKRWSNAYWADALTRLNELGNLRFIFVGTDDDAPAFDDIASRVSFPIHSLIGKLSLTELVIALAEADYFIGIDSGPMNLAHLVDLPSVSILGPGPHMYLPWNPRDRYIDKTGGRGLTQMFFASDHAFIKETQPREVVDAFMQIYGSSR